MFWHRELNWYENQVDRERGVGFFDSHSRAYSVGEGGVLFQNVSSVTFIFERHLKTGSSFACVRVCVCQRERARDAHVLLGNAICAVIGCTGCHGR